VYLRNPATYGWAATGIGQAADTCGSQATGTLLVPGITGFHTPGYMPAQAGGCKKDIGPAADPRVRELAWGARWPQALVTAGRATRERHRARIVRVRRHDAHHSPIVLPIAEERGGDRREFAETPAGVHPLEHGGDKDPPEIRLSRDFA
jgi:hypothetical protein